MLTALQLEKELNDGLLQLHATAEEKDDTEVRINRTPCGAN